MNKETHNQTGFSLIELVAAMAITVIILGVGVAIFSKSMSTRERETSRTDAMTSAQAALNIMSREIGNSGYGLYTNGLVLTDSDSTRLHFRANTVNTGGSLATDSAGEDVTFYCENCNGSTSGSVVRYDANASNPKVSGIINRISNVTFTYYNYTYTPGTGVTVSSATTPSANTARINIKLTVILRDVTGQPQGQTITLSSDVNLRNSPYMLGQY